MEILTGKHLKIILIVFINFNIFAQNTQSIKKHLLLGSYDEFNPKFIDSLAGKNNNVLWNLEIPFYYLEIIKSGNLNCIDTMNIQTPLNFIFTLQIVNQYQSMGIIYPNSRNLYLRLMLDSTEIKALEMELKTLKLCNDIYSKNENSFGCFDQDIVFDSLAIFRINEVIKDKIKLNILTIMLLEFEGFNFRDYEKENRYLNGYDYRYMFSHDIFFKPNCEKVILFLSKKQSLRRKQKKEFSKLYHIDKKLLRKQNTFILEKGTMIK